MSDRVTIAEVEELESRCRYGTEPASLMLLALRVARAFLALAQTAEDAETAMRTVARHMQSEYPRMADLEAEADNLHAALPARAAGKVRSWATE